MEKAEVGKTHYLSHHAVIRQDALTTKVRVVFDGSAQCYSGLPSLNDILETGNPIVPAIFGILLRFRSDKIPLVADIAQSFHQICVSNDDINCLRFLWVNDLNAVEPEIAFMRFLRVVFGLCSSPFLLGGTLQHHIKHYQPDDLKMSEATQAHDNPIQSRVAEDQSTFAKLSIGQLELCMGVKARFYVTYRTEVKILSYLNLISFLKLPKPCLLQNGMF